jgi:hypothetical protein
VIIWRRAWHVELRRQFSIGAVMVLRESVFKVKSLNRIQELVLRSRSEVCGLPLEGRWRRDKAPCEA